MPCAICVTKHPHRTGKLPQFGIEEAMTVKKSRSRGSAAARPSKNAGTAPIMIWPAATTISGHSSGRRSGVTAATIELKRSAGKRACQFSDAIAPTAARSRPRRRASHVPMAMITRTCATACSDTFTRARIMCSIAQATVRPARSCAPRWRLPSAQRCHSVCSARGKVRQTPRLLRED